MASSAEPRRSIRSGLKYFMTFSSTCVYRSRKTCAHQENDSAGENEAMHRALLAYAGTAVEKAVRQRSRSEQPCADWHQHCPRIQLYLALGVDRPLPRQIELAFPGGWLRV